MTTWFCVATINSSLNNTLATHYYKQLVTLSQEALYCELLMTSVKKIKYD